MFRLHAENSFHYHNLPDLTQYLRIALIHKNFNWNMITALMGAFCLQNKLKRKFQYPLSTPEKKAVLNVLHGLLLGLYPCNVQHGSFAQRCEIAGKMRELMIKGDTQFDHLLQLAFVEYLSNVVADFCPVEHAIIVKNSSSRFMINQACDTFRQNIDAVDFDMLNHRAHDVLINIQRHIKQMHFKLYKKNTTRFVKITDTIIQKALQLQHIPFCTHLAQINELCTLPIHVLQGIEHLWQNFTIHELPQAMFDKQERLLNAVTVSTSMHHSKSTLYVCIHCAMQNKKDVLQQQSAYNALTNDMHCHKCKRKQIGVNLIGRVLTIKKISYHLCEKCLSPCVWGSDCAKCTPEKIVAIPGCMICDNKHVVFSRCVLNVKKLRMERVYLCSRHAKNNIRSASTIYDIDMLFEDASAK